MPTASLEHLTPAHADRLAPYRRSHLPDGVKSKSWEDRMEKTKQIAVVKKLENEMKEEKKAEAEA